MACRISSRRSSRQPMLESDDRHQLVAEAYKELGFYYRNAGSWRKADDAYQQARDAISATLSARSSDEDRDEMASIQTNWAYVKGLSGSYRDGANLVESAITVRRRLQMHQEEGISWSVCGEVYRYERRFEKAWDAYARGRADLPRAAELVLAGAALPGAGDLPVPGDRGRRQPDARPGSGRAGQPPYHRCPGHLPRPGCPRAIRPRSTGRAGSSARRIPRLASATWRRASSRPAGCPTGGSGSRT